MEIVDRVISPGKAFFFRPFIGAISYHLYLVGSELYVPRCSTLLSGTYLEDHPMTDVIGSPPITSHKKGHLEGELTTGIGDLRSPWLLTTSNYLLSGMILQVPVVNGDRSYIAYEMVRTYTVLGKGPLFKYGPTIYPHLPKKTNLGKQNVFTHMERMGYEMCVNFWLFERTKWEEASLKSSKKIKFYV